MRILFLLISIMLSGLAVSQKESVVIMLDPGHGGEDPGHLPYTDSLKQEKELTLEIAQKVGNYLTYNLQNVEVLYTRTDDSYPTLDDRVLMANSKKVDLLISIHCNGSPKVTVSGTESHVHNKDAKDSYKLARMIETQFKSRAARNSRGVKTIDDLGHSLQILKYSEMPAVLIECGFITHPDEAKYLNSVYGQEIIASAIFRATREYLQKKYTDISFVPEVIEEPAESSIAATTILADTTTEEVTVQPKENPEPFYMVQIMASIDSVSTAAPAFAQVKQPVKRLCVESSTYKYKYYVGPYASRKDAKQYQKEVQEQGFKDAFLVYFD